MVALLLIANTLNLGADLGAMAECLRLLMPQVAAWIWISVLALFCALGQTFFTRQRYVGTLKWLTFSLLSYFAVLFVVHINWAELARGLIWPRWSGSRAMGLMVVAILGTTISPYLFFWQAGEEVEDTKADPERVPLNRNPAQGPSALARIRLDTTIGMAVSNLVGLAILVTAGATLHAGRSPELETAAQAAQALRPLVGNWAFALFTLGIVGAGLLSVPVLAGSAAYALAEARRWPVGLARRPLQAKAFYATIAIATFLGAMTNVVGLDPKNALVWAALINGIVAVPVMILVMLMARYPPIMAGFRVNGALLAGGWAATLVMAAAALAWAISLLTH